MNPYRLSFLFALGLTAPLAAQTKEQPQQEPTPTAQLWQLQIGGISG